MDAKRCVKSSVILIGCVVAVNTAFWSVAHAQIPISAGPVVRSLHQFESPNESTGWQIVNDGVMGGRSSSQATITQAGTMQFTGNISLANNGGFASVRSRPTGTMLGLASGSTIVMRVKGDGRKYTLNLYTPSRRTAFAYQMDFQTINGQWLEVRLPVDSFVAHSFGRAIPGMRLNPSQVQSIGILLGDKRSGGFQITIDSINVQ